MTVHLKLPSDEYLWQNKDFCGQKKSEKERIQRPTGGKKFQEFIPVNINLRKKLIHFRHL